MCSRESPTGFDELCDCSRGFNSHSGRYPDSPPRHGPADIKYRPLQIAVLPADGLTVADEIEVFLEFVRGIADRSDDFFLE